MVSGRNERITIAVVDDDWRLAQLIARLLKQAGFDVCAYERPADCLKEQDEAPADIVITDLRMPQMDGIEVLKAVKAKSPGTDVILVTGNADKRVAIEALRLGAFDFFEKPVQGDELIETVKRTVRYQHVVRERNHYAEQVSALAAREAAQWSIEGFVGDTVAVRKLVEDVRLLQKASDISVLITGESGTGKELVARAIHVQSGRAQCPFVPVNCSALPHELAESLLFGHVKGSFTGAGMDRPGCFEQADGGTLFLDEIGDMPPQVQSKLLRVLEDGNVLRVGDARPRHVNVRVIAATNTDLEQKTADGSFREDLYFRVSGFRLQVPPLRARREDISLLAAHFVKKLSSEMGRKEAELSAAAVAALQAYDFPGNVRELKNIIERALIVSGGCIEPSHLQFMPPRSVSGTGAADGHGSVTGNENSGTLADAERKVILQALTCSGGNVAKAARDLQINRTKLYRKLAALGISPSR